MWQSFTFGSEDWQKKEFSIRTSHKKWASWWSSEATSSSRITHRWRRIYKERQKLEISWHNVRNILIRRFSNHDICKDENEDEDEYWLAAGTLLIGQTRIIYPKFATVCDRYEVGNRCAVVLTSSILDDISKYVFELECLVFEESEVYCKRKKTRQELQREDFSPGSEMKAFTLTVERTRPKLSRRQITEHYGNLRK